MLLQQYEVGPYQNFTYLVAEAEGGEGVVIDPSFGIDPVLRGVDDLRVKVRFVLNTHSHPDHVAGNREVKERTGAKVVAHKVAPLNQDVSVDAGSRFDSGRLRFDVLHTPGHTPDSVLYLFEGHVATGDTLFVGECGRTDLPGGDPGQMYDSLFGPVLRLADATVVLPGHNYGATRTSTIGREKAQNYVLRPRTRDEFIRFLAE
ncbi:MAG TPA: MBL fold metallo-hydrolase [Thermoplasmata archaeon]|nr:MBL fold metallo-hydrolase [Thermoplasmata archaeon]